jgi:arylsulfatase A-like enzyme
MATRRAFLWSAAALAAGERPNIVWIMAEDFCPDLGCYGERLVRTPNLDGMAAQGVRFEHAFATAPVCSAARSAFNTGMYQTSIGAHHHRSHRNDGCRLPAGVKLISERFREAGYFTANLTAQSGLQGTGKTDFNFNVERPFDGADWTARTPGQPFYAHINFQETHRIFRRHTPAPVDPAKVKLPPFYPDHPALREDWSMYLDAAQNLDVKVGRVLRRLEEQGLRDSTILFFFGDHGQPMPRGKQFLYDSGIRVPLIAWFPERFRPAGVKPGMVRTDLVSLIDVTATSLAMGGIEIPQNMHGRMLFGPQAKPRDAIFAARDRCDETVDRIRAVRTARWKYIRNFMPERPYTQQNVYKDTQYPPLQVLRQLRDEGRLTGAVAEFMSNRRPAEELYDLEADPGELRNLAGSPAQSKTLSEMRGRLDAWIRETGDQGARPESGVEEQDRYRIEVDGWCLLQSQSALSRSGGVLKVECTPRSDQLARSWVAPAGRFRVRFRARSKDAPVAAVQWMTIEEMFPAPARRKPVEFRADGEWHEFEAAFEVPSGHLARIQFEFGAVKGTVEFDWVRLEREGTGLEKSWVFD